MQGTRMSVQKRECKQCGRVLTLNEKNFRYHKGAYSRLCRVCIRRQDKGYYQRKIRPALQQKAALRQGHIEELTQRYEAIFKRLRQLGIDPCNNKYTAEQIDEILKHGKKAVRKFNHRG